MIGCCKIRKTCKTLFRFYVLRCLSESFPFSVYPNMDNNCSPLFFVRFFVLMAASFGLLRHVVLVGRIQKIRLLSKYLCFLDIVDQETQKNLQVRVKIPELYPEDSYPSLKTLFSINQLIKCCGTIESTGRTNPETMEEGVRLRLSSIPIFVENSEETDTLSFSEENQLCKKWLQMFTLEDYRDQKENIPKSCMMECTRRHYFQNENEATNVLQWRQKRLEDAIRDIHPQDPFLQDQKKPKAEFENTLADWITLHFPETQIIIDIAGGNGLLSNSLSSKMNGEVQTIVIDPNPRPKRTQIIQAQQKRDGRTPTIFIKDFFTHTFFEGHQFASLKIDFTKQKCLIVGLHPDEATEPLIDVALQFDLPFVCVPCCIFPVKKTEERMTFIDWISFLESKQDKIERDFLPVLGRNVLLFKR